MEFYRNIRTNIAFSKKYENVKSIVFTSSIEKEGKSTVLSNLAKLFAQIDKKVLVIDANSKNPSATNMLSENEINEGLVDALKNNEYFKYIKETSTENLFLLSSGENITSDYLSSEKMKNMMDKLKEKFDYIFIDSLSLTDSSDALVLSTYCEGVILICGCGEVEIEKVEDSKEKLQNVGANILGVIMNKFEE